MKKILLIVCGLALAGTAAAQESVLKEAKRALTVEVPDHAGIAAMLKGAMSDPTTANDVQTWYLAGKNGFQTWQTGRNAMALGERPDEANMSRALIDGFDYFAKAFTLDTIVTVDKKGNEKVKTKYSKDMVSAIVSNYPNFEAAFGTLYNAGDMANAYHALQIFTMIPSYAPLGAKAPAMPADSIMAQNYYNLGVLARSIDKNDEAVGYFEKAVDLDFGESAYYQIVSVAEQLEKYDILEKYSLDGFSKFDDSYFLSQLVNLYARQHNYKKGYEIISAALEKDPTNATLTRFKGLTLELLSDENGTDPAEADKLRNEAYSYYAKAYELAPQDPEAMYHYARTLTAQAYKISDDAVDVSNEEFKKLEEEEITPRLRKAAEVFEAALKIDPETHSDIYTMLKGIYYNLKDEENMTRIEQMM